MTSPRITATARIRDDALGSRLGTAMTDAVAEAARRSATAPDDRGWCDIEIPAESLDIAHDWLIRLGDAIAVIDPPELRDRHAATGQAIAANHANPCEPAALRRPPLVPPRGCTEGC